MACHLNFRVFKGTGGIEEPWRLWWGWSRWKQVGRMLTQGFAARDKIISLLDPMIPAAHHWGIRGPISKLSDISKDKVHLGCNSTHHREPEIIHQLNSSWRHFVPVSQPNLSHLCPQRQKAAAKRWVLLSMLLLLLLRRHWKIEELHWKWPQSETVRLQVQLNWNYFSSLARHW